MIAQPNKSYNNAILQRQEGLRETSVASSEIALCVPGMGVFLLGESSLYIVWRVVIIISHLKSTCRRQGRKGDRPPHVKGDRRIDDHVIFKVDQASVPWFSCPATPRHFW
jgi:hypothetical protein